MCAGKKGKKGINHKKGYKRDIKAKKRKEDRMLLKKSYFIHSF